MTKKVWSRAKVYWLANADGTCAPGLKVAPKAFTIIYQAELGKPYMFPLWGYLTARGEMT